MVYCSLATGSVLSASVCSYAPPVCRQFCRSGGTTVIASCFASRASRCGGSHRHYTTDASATRYLRYVHTFTPCRQLQYCHSGSSHAVTGYWLVYEAPCEPRLAREACRGVPYPISLQLKNIINFPCSFQNCRFFDRCSHNIPVL